MKISKKELLNLIKEEATKLKEQIEKTVDTLDVDMTQFDSLKSSSHNEKALVYKDTKKKEEKAGPQTKEFGGYDEKAVESINSQDKEHGSDEKSATAVKVDAGKVKGESGPTTGQHTAKFTAKKDNPKMEASQPFDAKKFDGKMNIEDKLTDKEVKTFVEPGTKIGGKGHTSGQAKAMPKEKAPVVKDKAPIANGVEIEGSNVGGKKAETVIKESYTKTELINFIKEEAKKIAEKDMLNL